MMGVTADRDAAFVRIEQVSKSYGDVVAVDHLSLDIRRGEFFSLLGPSGCGKTTLLRILAGFERPEHGRVIIDGIDVTDKPPYERAVNMMFQSYALFPHMTVADNIAYGLKQEGMPKPAREQRVREMLALVQIETLASRKPDQLSGGQRQRVALARALARHPALLLLDEPLAALDKKLREETRLELVRLQEQLGITFIIVTHDQEEAMTLSSRIGLMRAGQLEQVDTPRQIYEHPLSRYAAEFIGLVNLLSGTVQHVGNGLVRVRCDDSGIEWRVRSSVACAEGDKVTVAIRPEAVSLVGDGMAAENRVQGIIRDIAYLGDFSVCHAVCDGDVQLKFTAANPLVSGVPLLQRGQQVVLGWRADCARLLQT